MSKLGFSKFFISLSLVCFLLTAFLYYQRNNPRSLAFDINQSINYSGKKSKTPQPTVIIIEDLNIKLPIIPAKIISNSWETTDIGVSYLTISPKPGEMGNSILYGHNWTNLLGKLTLVKPGQKIIIVYPKNDIKKFQVEYTTTTSPKDISVLSQTKDKRITIYTCTGFLDSKRFVVVAKAV